MKVEIILDTHFIDIIHTNFHRFWQKKPEKITYKIHIQANALWRKVRRHVTWIKSLVIPSQNSHPCVQKQQQQQQSPTCPEQSPPCSKDSPVSKIVSSVSKIVRLVSKAVISVSKIVYPVSKMFRVQNSHRHVPKQLAPSLIHFSCRTTRLFNLSQISTCADLPDLTWRKLLKVHL